MSTVSLTGLPSVSPRRIGLTVGIGSIIILSMAVPSWGRHRSSLRATDGLCHTPVERLEPACSKDLQRAFADLIEPVDPATHQRPAYPTTGELFARLLPIPRWQRAALFAGDVGAKELRAAGLDNEHPFYQPPLALPDGMPNPFGFCLVWQLVLIDDAGFVVGRTLLQVPTLETEKVGDGDETAFATYPVLEKRLPAWPRVAVFNRPAPEAQSDG